MDRRILMFVVLSVLASGCASLEEWETPHPAAARSTPEQEYLAGLSDQERGDYEAARKDWDRCLELARPDSPRRLDCLVALESMPVSTVPDGKE